MAAVITSHLSNLVAIHKRLSSFYQRKLSLCHLVILMYSVVIVRVTFEPRHLLRLVVYAYREMFVN